MKTIHKLAQGDAAWHAHRAHHFNASEASAMMGLSPYVSRSDLVKAYALGVEREVSPQEQERFDDGHTFEAMARPWAEEIIGEALYPITASLLVDGLPLSASFDGATIGDDVTFEHKTLSADLDAALARGEIPHHYKPQMEQQLLILGAEKCLFMASRGSRETMRHAWYTSDPAIRAALLSGWRQFQADLAAYEHTEVAPLSVVAPIEDLPALTVELVGEVKHSNLVLFKSTVLARIQAINTDLKTDNDFAAADKMVKFLDDGEKRLDLVKSQAMSQTASIDELFRTIDALKGEMRAKRLTLNNLVKARKEEIRGEILREGQLAFSVHHAKLNERFGRKFMPTIPTDFPGAMRGKKTVASLRDAVAVELSRAKIEANAVADAISANLKTLGAEAQGFEHLFADLDRLVLKAPEDFVVLVRARITEHRAAEERRLEAERARIREEEAAKLRAEEDARQRAAQPIGQVQPEPQYRMPQSAPKPAMPSAKSRPTDEEIIAALALHYRVHENIVIAWLADMDIEAASARLSKQFAA